MSYKTITKRSVLHFACWSRKSFALFAAIGKEVKITALAIGMCQCAFLKSAKNGTIINSDSVCTKELYKDQGQKIALIFGSIATLIGNLYLVVNTMSSIRRDTTLKNGVSLLFLW